MPHKERRKIIQAGQSSLAVTIPKGWIRYFGLEAGDNVRVVSNDKIIIRPTASEGKE